MEDKPAEIKTTHQTNITDKDLLKLKMRGYTYRKMEELTGIPHETIFSRFSRLYSLMDQDKAEQWKKNKDVMLSNAEFELLCDVMNKQKRAKSTQGNAAYALDKVNNIRRLEAGQSTQIIGLPGMVQEAAERIKALEIILNEGAIEVKESIKCIDTQPGNNDTIEVDSQEDAQLIDDKALKYKGLVVSDVCNEKGKESNGQAVD